VSWVGPIARCVAVPLVTVSAVAGTMSGPTATPPAKQEPRPSPSAAPRPPALAGAAVFREASRDAGLDFVHFNGMTGNYTIAEIMGSGGALLDYDRDGDLDVFLVQQALLGQSMSEAVFPWRGKEPPISRLYRADLTAKPGGGNALRYVDVTSKSGLGIAGYCNGAATGDIDNDGHVDLYVTCLGPNHLMRNRGDGTFEEITAKAGVNDSHWSMSASFVDNDRDGFLDLYVTNYVDFETNPRRPCFAVSSARDFCGPKAYKPVPHRLFRNRGGGTFQDVTASAGVGREPGAGLGVVAADVNRDGWLDIFVANDGDADFLFVNQKDGTFKNEALWSGAALSGTGKAISSMGVDAGDFDNDGDDDLFVTNIMQEPAALHVNDGSGLFEDRTIAAGLAAGTRGKTGFGSSWFDYDNDGWLDMIVVTGAVLVIPELARQGDPYPLSQTPDLFHNNGKGGFEQVSSSAGPFFQTPAIARGVLFGDLDNDGDTDLVVAINNGPVKLLLNEVGQRNRWLGLRLLAKTGGRDALGAYVEIQRAGRPPLRRRAHTDGSYCSASDPRVLVGLGADGAISGLRVLWPSGAVESWPALSLGRYHTLREGASPRTE
jgi:hypothetical protein